MKKCIECNLDKPLEDFHKKASGKDGRQSRCKSCNKAKAKEWQAENAGRHEEYWRTRDADTARRQAYQFVKRARLYGLTPEELQAMLDEAAGVCDLCKRPTNKLVVDHCHNTLKVRGLLCGNCNTALGLLRDDLGTIERALIYLKNN